MLSIDKSNMRELRLKKFIIEKFCIWLNIWIFNTLMLSTDNCQPTTTIKSVHFIWKAVIFHVIENILSLFNYKVHSIQLNFRWDYHWKESFFMHLSDLWFNSENLWKDFSQSESKRKEIRTEREKSFAKRGIFIDSVVLGSRWQSYDYYLFESWTFPPPFQNSIFW